MEELFTSLSVFCTIVCGQDWFKPGWLVGWLQDNPLFTRINQIWNLQDNFSKLVFWVLSLGMYVCMGWIGVFYVFCGYKLDSLFLRCVQIKHRPLELCFHCSPLLAHASSSHPSKQLFDACMFYLLSHMLESTWLPRRLQQSALVTP